MLRYLFIIIISLFASNAFARSQIRIVGSSTLYSFVTVSAEYFGKHYPFKTPIVETNGTGGGINLFCLGVGDAYPDLANASRAIKPSELDFCKKNNVGEVLEFIIGYDGIVMASGNKSPDFTLTKKQLFLALAKLVPYKGGLVNNFYQRWDEVDPSLPKQKITIYGPSGTSGTREAFAELVMKSVCMNMQEYMDNLPVEEARVKQCQMIRNDDAFIEAGENDNLIIQKLLNNKLALGIIGYNFLSQNDQIKPAKIDAVIPSFESISSGEYTISRPLYIYAKLKHLQIIPGLMTFIEHIFSDMAITKDGYLMNKGLIPLGEKELKAQQDKISALLL